MGQSLQFEVQGTPQPQGSARAFIVGGKARITSANAKMMPFRQQVTQMARYTIASQNAPEPMFSKQTPVRLVLDFTFRKPVSAPKRRTHCAVKPDVDKLCRMAADALTGSVWHDDAQVVELIARKHYGQVEGMRVQVEGIE